nr:ATP-binding protein [Rhodoferax sp.]
MESSYSEILPEQLLQRLSAYGGTLQYRRRAVLLQIRGRWELVCCTVEGFLPGEHMPQSEPSRKYRQAVLYEDFLSADASVAFANELQNRTATFGTYVIQGTSATQWTTESVSLENSCMSRAGSVVKLRFGANGHFPPAGRLLVPEQPFYPDIYDAAGDWLPFPGYHGEHDGRQEEVLFLLPETRAFVASSDYSEDGLLSLKIAGTEADDIRLTIKGAYWEEKSIRQLSAVVGDLRAELTVPSHVDRLEYFLIDREGTVYDFHREDRFSGHRLVRNTKSTLENQVRRATYEGEGQQVEFKPFVDPDQRYTSDGPKTKLREVITTAVAFANTEGGHIYLGVDDDCVATGIEQELQQWAKAKVDGSVIERYLGSLKSKIKDSVSGDLTLSASHAFIDEVLVAIIEVKPNEGTLVNINQDYVVYARSGASNRKVPPSQIAPSPLQRVE